MANEIKTTNNSVVKANNITDAVLVRVNKLTESNQLILPKNYVPANALKSAYLNLKANNLLNTDQDALANALLNMVVQGLTPAKNQCYFINYGGKVNMMRSYHGDRAVAILAGIAKDIQAYVIYKGDEVNISYDADTNFLVVDHKTNFENWDKPIIGAYAVAIMPDGTKRYDLMTIERIKQSWNMSSNKSNNKLQTSFSSDACQRTVTRHLVKNLFNQSTDESLIIDNVLTNNQEIDAAEAQQPRNADIEYTEAEEVAEAQANEQVITPNIEGTSETTLQQEETPKPSQEDIFSKHLGGGIKKEHLDF